MRGSCEILESRSILDDSTKQTNEQPYAELFPPGPAVEQAWHTPDSQGQTLALDFRLRSSKLFKVSLLQSEADIRNRGARVGTRFWDATVPRMSNLHRRDLRTVADPSDP